MRLLGHAGIKERAYNARQIATLLMLYDNRSSNQRDLYELLQSVLIQFTGNPESFKCAQEKTSLEMCRQYALDIIAPEKSSLYSYAPSSLSVGVASQQLINVLRQLANNLRLYWNQQIAIVSSDIMECEGVSVLYVTCFIHSRKDLSVMRRLCVVMW